MRLTKSFPNTQLFYQVLFTEPGVLIPKTKYEFGTYDLTSRAMKFETKYDDYQTIGNVSLHFNDNIVSLAKHLVRHNLATLVNKYKLNDKPLDIDGGRVIDLSIIFPNENQFLWVDDSCQVSFCVDKDLTFCTLEDFDEETSTYSVALLITSDFVVNKPDLIIRYCNL